MCYPRKPGVCKRVQEQLDHLLSPPFAGKCVQLSWLRTRFSLASRQRWLVGCLVGWLIGWLVGWLVGCLVGWLIGWLVPFSSTLQGHLRRGRGEELALISSARFATGLAISLSYLLHDRNFLGI